MASPWDRGPVGGLKAPSQKVPELPCGWTWSAPQPFPPQLLCLESLHHHGMATRLNLPLPSPLTSGDGFPVKSHAALQAPAPLTWSSQMAPLPLGARS